jgi:hypothetical protein
MGIRPCITFPPPSLKFRTAGFPQYGFKPAVGGHLRPRGLIGAPKPFQSSLTVAQKGNRRTASASRRDPSRRTGPEALGSATEGFHLPTGCAVPSRHRLLWPHPSFWSTSGGLWFFVRRTLGGPEGPCFKLRIRLVVPLPVPRRTRRPEDDWTSARDSLRPNATGSASAIVPLESVRVGCPNEAAEFASCCGPTSCLPFTDKDVYVRAFIP